MIDPNDPAFPVKAYRVIIPKKLMTPELAIGMQEIEETIPGLTKREYFAAMVLQGAIANPNQPLMIKGEKVPLEKVAVILADALIKELSK